MASNGSNGGVSANALRGGGRVLLACDNCRQRKSRCDGLRPRCSHCVQSGRTCLYRSTPTNLESDASVLARLADTEARLQVLEEKNRMLMATLPSLTSQGSSSVAAVLGGSPQSMELFHHQQQQHHIQSQYQQYQQQQQHLQSMQAQQAQQVDASVTAATTTTAGIDADTTRTPPDLHTAAAFKLLTCWPRLTINMTIPQLDTQTYLPRCDQADPLLRSVGESGGREVEPVAAWQANLSLEQLYLPALYQQLPVAMVVLLETYPGFHHDRILASFAEASHGGSVSAATMSDPMDADMVTMDEVTVAAATQLQQFHGGSSRNTHGDSLYDHHQRQQHQQQRSHSHQNHTPQQPFDYERLSFAQLLILSVSFQNGIGSIIRESNNNGHRTPFDPPSNAMLLAGAKRTCTLALQKLWTLQAGPPDDLVPQVLMMAYYLAYFWVRPFNARGLLQSIDQSIKHLAMLQADDPDINTELDGFSTLSSASLLAMPPLEPATAVSGAGPIVPVSSLLLAASPTTPTSTSSSAIDQHTHNHLQQRSPQRTPKFHIENHVRLRILLNRILHLLYAPTKAYAQPHELADIVYSLTAGLRNWYQAQPPDQQFVRDATVFNINQPASSSSTAGSVGMPLRLRETALRYFGCVFLLHRPVLYFFLHKDLEYTVRPPENVRTLHVDREPWVLESCRDCIESAALLIHLSCLTDQERAPTKDESTTVEDTYGSWCGLQVLFAAYLILLQVRSVPSLQPIFRNIGDMDALLDKVERAFARHPVRSSLILDKSLAILQDERRNFEAASPLTHMT
ncbi:hypothetical protein SEUCBS139899_007036 [Sporothrix eucalyptigena]